MSVTDIINMALSLIGIAPISSPSDTTHEAREASVWYNATRQALLREHPWNFAIKIDALNSVAQTPFDYKYAYALPPLCLKVIRLRRQGGREFGEDCISFTVRGNTVYTDLENAYIEYISNVVDTTFFDPIFREALVYRLAARLAITLTARTDLVQVYEQRAADVLNDSRVCSSREERNISDDNPYVTARG